MKKLISTLAFAALGLTGCGGPAPSDQPAATPSAPTAPSAAKPQFEVAWSHYTGWEPWGYADHAGILKKWADKNGIEIKLSLVNDYVESINLYTSGKFDACAMTNMDALTIPAVGGIDSQAVIVGDFSNGNDGIVMKNGNTLADLKGRTVNLVELSVSHYLLARALVSADLKESDLKIVNTSDADIAGLFASDQNGIAVTWNPPLMQARASPGAILVYDSSRIPGEIMDLMVVKTGSPDALKNALTGAWFETIALLNGSGPETEAAKKYMAEASGGTVDDFNAQLKTTAMFYLPSDGAAFAASGDVRNTMEKVRQFTFSKGLFGQGAASPDAVGIEFDDGSTLGSKDNIKLRFTARYMKAAADGKL